MGAPHVLAHDGGDLFAVWNEKIDAYAMYFSEADPLPSPESLEIIGASGLVTMSSLKWLPVSSLKTVVETEHFEVYVEEED
jgi:hypothetical protein